MLCCGLFRQGSSIITARLFPYIHKHYFTISPLLLSLVTHFAFSDIHENISHSSLKNKYKREEKVFELRPQRKQRWSSVSIKRRISTSAVVGSLYEYIVLNLPRKTAGNKAAKARQKKKTAHEEEQALHGTASLHMTCYTFNISNSQTGCVEAISKTKVKRIMAD